MENLICNLCQGKGWIDIVAFGSSYVNDETCIIEKCDKCNIFTDDNEAAKFALKTENIIFFKNQNGVNIKANFHLN